MKLPIIAVALGAVTLAGAAPASAQYAGGGMAPPATGYNGGGGFWNGAPVSPRERIEWLQQRIDRGVADGSLDRREAYRAQSELRRIREMARNVWQRSGGNPSESDRAMIQGRLDELSGRLRFMRHNDERAGGERDRGREHDRDHEHDRDRGGPAVGGGYGFGGDFFRGAPPSNYERVQWLEQRIARARADGSLSPREAARAQHELDRTREYYRMARQRYGQLRPEDETYISQRLTYVSQNIRWMQQNGR